jgi:hypothetical protein
MGKKAGLQVYMLEFQDETKATEKPKEALFHRFAFSLLGFYFLSLFISSLSFL